MRARTCKLIRTYEHALANLRICERLWCRREFACCSYMRTHRTRFNRRFRSKTMAALAANAARQTHGSGAPQAGPTSERFFHRRISVGVAADVVILQRCSEQSNYEHTHIVIMESVNTSVITPQRVSTQASTQASSPYRHCDHGECQTQQLPKSWSLERAH